MSINCEKGSEWRNLGSRIRLLDSVWIWVKGDKNKVNDIVRNR